MHCSIILKPKTIFNLVFSVWLTSLFSLHLPLLYLLAWWLYCHGWWISINNKIGGDFFMGFSWWLLAGVVVGLLGGGWVFFWWVVHGWLMVVRGFACSRWVCLVVHGFVGLFVIDGCSRCCGGFAWLMLFVVGFFGAVAWFFWSVLMGLLGWWVWIGDGFDMWLLMGW